MRFVKNDESRAPAGLIVGHSNMDLDCLGSMALAASLFPDHRPVASRLTQPAVREALTVYQYELPLLSLRDIRGPAPAGLIVVDTRSKSRIREFLEVLETVPERITIYDHHRSEEADIPGARLVESPHGAQSTTMALMCREAGIAPAPDIATIALAGIFADTGAFLHDSSTPGDFEAASWLLSRGASLKMVHRLLRPLREESQADLFHRVLGSLTWRRFHGHVVALSRVEIPEQTSGVAEVADRVFASEPVDVLIILVDIRDRGHHLLIGRSRRERFNLLEVLADFGAHGHVAAASALVKDARDIWDDLLDRLETVPADALTAADLMTGNVQVLVPDLPVIEASKFFERTGFSGAPVLDGNSLVGMFTLKDVSKARKAGAMGAPVSAYMSRRVVSCSPGDTVREVERHMLGGNVGHLPVMEGTRMVGIVTRGDYKRLYS